MEREHNPAVTRRRFLEIGGAAGVGLAVAGVGDVASARARVRSAASSKTLNVVCESGGQGELTPIVAAYKKQTGTTVNLIVLPYDGLYSRINSDLSSGSISFDVAAMDVIWLAQFAPGLMPIDQLFTPAVKADLFPSLVADAQLHGHYVGMPAWTNSEILFYRKDLFDNSKNAKEFKARFGYDLEPPKTWQQFIDASVFFTKAPSLYGTDVKGDVETEWLAHVLQAGSDGVVLDRKGNVIITNSGHEAALAFYAGLHNKYNVNPPGAAQAGWPEAQNYYQQGKTAMMRFWAHAYPLIPKNSPVYGKTGVVEMIGGKAGVAGIPGPFYLGIPEKGSNNSAALEFVKFVYDNNALCIQSSLGLAARKSAFAKYENDPKYANFKPLLATLSAPATQGRPLVTQWQQIVDTVLVPMLQKAVANDTDYAGLLKTAESQVHNLIG